MGRELNFGTGYWEGDVVYSCDCCGKEVRFEFWTEEEEHNISGQRSALRKKRGWIFTKVNGLWRDFCSEKCRNQYIRENTI